MSEIVRIIDGSGIHPEALNQAVKEQRLYKEGRLIPTKSSFIFVFGSNESGHHGGGAARHALSYKGAQMGVSFGPQGMSFAIPTKDPQIRFALPLTTIKNYVDAFIAYAKVEKNLVFQITQIGCGLAGLKKEDIASMFWYAPTNCLFDTDWEELLPLRAKFWGHI
jgi:hypothetical protein